MGFLTEEQKARMRQRMLRSRKFPKEFKARVDDVIAFYDKYGRKMKPSELEKILKGEKP